MYEARLLPEGISRKNEIRITCYHENFEFMKDFKLGQKGKFKVQTKITSENLEENDEVSKRVKVLKIEIEKEAAI